MGNVDSLVDDAEAVEDGMELGEQNPNADRYAIVQPKGSQATIEVLLSDLAPIP